MPDTKRSHWRASHEARGYMADGITAPRRQVARTTGGRRSLGAQAGHITVAHGAQAEALFEHADEGVGVGPAEAAADRNGSDRWVVHYQLVGVVAVELGHRFDQRRATEHEQAFAPAQQVPELVDGDRKSTRLNSSH